MKRLIVLLIFIFLGCASTETVSVEPINTLVISEQEINSIKEIKGKNGKLIEFMLSDTEEFYLIKSEMYYLGRKLIRIRAYTKQNLSEHNNFDWNWKDHIVELTYYKEPEFRVFALVFTTLEYQEFVSPDSRGVIILNVFNRKADGKHIEGYRDYRVIMQNNLFISPKYPSGYINFNWYNLTKEEKVSKYKEELDYWLNKIKIGETEEEKEKRILDSLKGKEDC